MKGEIRVASLILLLSAAMYLSGCYEPVANTQGVPDEASGASDRTQTDRNDGEMTERNDNTNGEAVGGDVTALEGFRANLEANLKRHGLTPSGVFDETNDVENRILREYGAVLLTKADPPSKMMFTSDGEVTSFQASSGVESHSFNGVNIELQPEAMAALKEAAKEAGDKGLSITPRDGEEAGRRSFGKTLELWNSRFLKACDHWQQKGRLTAEQTSRLKSLPIREQVGEVLKLEKTGIYFNTFFNNSILYSVAAPGTSQHLSMLAFDANEYGNPAVRKILASYGWFRTVQNDSPHFTFLGYGEGELQRLGLKKVNKSDGEYWVPDI